MKFLGVIPARGGSKGVPRKNIYYLAGKPLICWTIEAAKKASCFDMIVVSTDDEEIALVAKKENVDVISRPANLAQDDTTTLAVLQHTIKYLSSLGHNFDAVITLQPTSPLRSYKHIDEAAKIFKNDQVADSLVSVVNVPHIYNPKSVMVKNKEGYLESYMNSDIPTRRQDKEITFARNGAAIYITRIDCIENFIFGGRLIPYSMINEDSIDIDEEIDFVTAEKVLNERLSDEN